MSLPEYMPELVTNASNLAGLAAAIAPPLNPNRRRYVAADGTQIGYGNNCDPLSMEMGLSAYAPDPEFAGLVVPDILSENRMETMQEWALPALVGTMEFARTGRAFPTALWALGAYMAPLPVAAFLGWMMVRAMPTTSGARR